MISLRMNFILQINVGVVKLTGESGTGKPRCCRNWYAAQGGAAGHCRVLLPTCSFQQVKEIVRQQLNLDSAANFHDAVLVIFLPGLWNSVGSR